MLGQPALRLCCMQTHDATDSYRHWDLDRSCIGIESFQYRYIVANDVVTPRDTSRHDD
jgi:hypothetical protein